MQVCKVTVRLGDSPLHVLPNKIVTVPEIQVLRHVHGANAVINIRPYGRGGIDPETNSFDPAHPHPFHPDEERERLRTNYERNNLDEGSLGMISRLFGEFGPLPERLKDIGVDPKAEAARLRAQADEAAAALDALGSEFDAEEAADDAEFDELAAEERAVEPAPARRGRRASADMLG